MTHDSQTATAESLFLHNLRTQTDTAHKNLEQLPVSSALLKPTVTSAEYSRYLKLMYDMVVSAEKDVFPMVAHIVPEVGHEDKSKAIAADLEFSGSAKPSAFQHVFGRPESVGFALGIAYVIEGSTLGGRVILKNISQVLSYDENGGASYFYGYGGKTGSHWKAFLEKMTAFAISENQEQAVIDGANFAFGKIHGHLNCFPEI